MARRLWLLVLMAVVVAAVPASAQATSSIFFTGRLSDVRGGFEFTAEPSVCPSGAGSCSYWTYVKLTSAEYQCPANAWFIGGDVYSGSLTAWGPTSYSGEFDLAVFDGYPSFGRKRLCLYMIEYLRTDVFAGKRVLLAQTEFDFPAPPAQRPLKVTKTWPADGEVVASATQYDLAFSAPDAPQMVSGYVRVSTSPNVDADGWLTDNWVLTTSMDPTFYRTTFPTRTPWPPGTYYWQGRYMAKDLWSGSFITPVFKFVVAAPQPTTPAPAPAASGVASTPLSLSVAKANARRALKRRFGSAYRRKRQFKLTCKPRSISQARCRVSWRYKRSRYSGTITVTATSRFTVTTKVAVRRC